MSHRAQLMDFLPSSEYILEQKREILTKQKFIKYYIIEGEGEPIVKKENFTVDDDDDDCQGQRGQIQ